MATVTYNCTGCVVIDRAVIDAYNILTSTEEYVSSAESDRATAEEARVLAEQGRVQQASDDHGVAQEDHRIAVADHGTAGDDHTTATGDHRTASDDHTTAVADHGTASDDHVASTSATDRANDAAAAAEHMVDIHQGPPGPEGKPAVLGNNGNWWTWDEDTEQYVDTGQRAQGPTGATPNFAIGTVSTGAAGSQAAATITGTTDNPLLNLTIPQGLKGDQGNTGSSVDYPYELVNNETTDDATKGATAASAKRLKDELSQLEADLTEYEYERGQIDEENDAKVFGGSPVIMPYGLTKLNWEQANHSRKVAFENGEIVFYASGVAGCLASQADANIFNESKAFLQIDTSSDFWTNDARQLKLDVEYSCGYAANLRIYYRKENNTNLGYTDAAIPSGTGTTTVDVRSLLMTAQPSSYSHINQITVGGFYHQGETYGTIQAKTAGFYSTYVGAIPGVESALGGIEDKGKWLEETNLVSIATKTTGKYAKYEDGYIYSTSASLETYEVAVDNYDQIIVRVAGNGTTAAAIAFYGDNAPDNYSYLGGVQSESTTGKWFVASVPVGAKTMVVTNYYADVPTPKILGQSSKEFRALKDADNTPWIDGTNLLSGATRTTQKYARYSDGVLPTSGAANEIEAIQFSVVGYDIIWVYVASSDAVPAAIAFYTSATPGSGSYIKGRSVQIKAGFHWYSAIVPSSAVCAVVSNKYGYLINPVIMGGKAEPMKLLSETGEGMAKKTSYSGLALNKLFYHHINVEVESAYTTIPSQSLMDIRYAKELGFDFIEANVQKCSDDVYVVKHGNNGTLGAGVKLIGGGDCSTVRFDEVTSTWLRENVVYDSTIAKDCVSIPTLEEFCKEAKNLNIGILVAGYTNADDVLPIVRKYLPDEKTVFLGLTERGDYKGMISVWESISSVDDAVAFVERYGLPFELGWNISSYLGATQTLIDSVVAKMHEMGALVGTAYVNATNAKKAKEDGLDFLGSTYKVTNPSLIGNLHNIKKMNDSALVLSSGASYDSAADKITMSNGATITLPNTGHDSDFVKMSLSVRHTGTINILVAGLDMVSYSLYNQTGDGMGTIDLSSVIEMSPTIVQIVAVGSAEILELSIVTSLVM